MEISWEYHLVGGIPTPLQNDGVRQWEGWHPIYEMENKKCLKPPTSHGLGFFVTKNFPYIQWLLWRYPVHCWMDKNDKSYRGWLRNPNHQLIDGKHPIIYRVSTILLVVQDFATIHCINGWFGHNITCHARQPDAMDAIKKRRCRGHGTEFCRGKKLTSIINGNFKILRWRCCTI